VNFNVAATMPITPNAVVRAEDLELPGCLCWAPVRRKVEAAQHPPLLLGYLQETHKWPLASFLRIGTLRRHFGSLDANKAPILR
jgi:hypothetical protein